MNIARFVTRLKKDVGNGWHNEGMFLDFVDGGHRPLLHGISWVRRRVLRFETGQQQTLSRAFLSLADFSARDISAVLAVVLKLSLSTTNLFQLPLSIGVAQL